MSYYNDYFRSNYPALTDFLLKQSGVSALQNVNIPKKLTAKQIQENKNLEIKKSLVGVDVESCFDVFSLELTYIPEIMKDFKYDERVFRNVASGFYRGTDFAKYKILPNTHTSIFGTRWKVENDDVCLEISTGKSSNFKSIMNDVQLMESRLEKIGYIASSLADMEVEGGCHINIDLKKLNDMHSDLPGIFVNRIAILLCKFPSAVWAFLSPNDNNSSRIVYNKEVNVYSKGDMLTYSSSYDKLELRFFMMPRNSNEAHLHYDFAMAILKHTLHELVKDYEKAHVPSSNFKFDALSLKTITYENAIKNLKKLCKIIKFDFKRIEDARKLELLEERISYGSKWML